jgi:Lrp/AsnC family leucine-responsive transcriptional regulator
MEEDGVIRHYTVELDARALGFAMEAIVRIEPLPGRLRDVEETILAMPEVTACDVVTGDDCFVARLALRSIEDLDVLLQPMHHLARTSSSIVKRRLVSHRAVPLS